MDKDLAREIETVAHQAEVSAVVQAMDAGREPALGEVFTYALDLPPSLCKRKQKYQFAVEQWHIEAARHSRNQQFMSRLAFARR